MYPDPNGAPLWEIPKKTRPTKSGLHLRGIYNPQQSHPRTPAKKPWVLVDATFLRARAFPSNGRSLDACNACDICHCSGVPSRAMTEGQLVGEGYIGDDISYPVV